MHIARAGREYKGWEVQNQAGWSGMKSDVGYCR